MTLSVVKKACSLVGLGNVVAEPIRLTENAIWRLPKLKLVVRVPREGRHEASLQELTMSRWLAEHGVSAVRAYPGVDQPVDIDGRAVTFWEELPPHKPGTVLDVVRLLKQLHSLPIPSFLRPLEPLTQLVERISPATYLDKRDRALLFELSDSLDREWETLPPSRAQCVLHGDAWVGNCIVDERGDTYLLDFERACVGLPEWDLVSTAMKLTSTQSVTTSEYAEFCRWYGYDVTAWAGYPTLRSIRELRMTAWTVWIARERPELRDEARYRVDCLLGRAGSRPWCWRPIL